MTQCLKHLENIRTGKGLERGHFKDELKGL